MVDSRATNFGFVGLGERTIRITDCIASATPLAKSITSSVEPRLGGLSSGDIQMDIS